ncbi:MAG: 5-dehydro-2-deoxygluconokinase [Chloroflexi bacterium]|nr:MAG: 5-dehydro-2-deoxygluconokinase [Chloroflexota bacterium]
MNTTGRSYDVITMGRSSIDLYSNDVGAPFVDITSFAAYVGGCPTNISVGTQRLGLHAALLTAVGDDQVGNFILHFLEQEGVETRFIPRKIGRRSSAVVLGIEPPDRFPLTYYRDNCADIELTIDDVLATPIAESRALLISGTGLGVTLRSALRLVDVVLGTEDEINATMLTDTSQMSLTHSQVSDTRVSGDITIAIKALLALGPHVLAQKRGADGSTVHVVSPEGQTTQIDAPGFPVEVSNILGAGDAFASGLLYGMVNGWDWYKAARLGNACGAILVTKHGCANFTPTHDEVMAFISDHGGF